MPRRAVSLVENGAAASLDITSQEEEALRRDARHWYALLRTRQEPFTLTTTAGISLQAREVTGFVRLGPVDIEVAPKFLDGDVIGSTWRTALYRVLTLLGEFSFEAEWTSAHPQAHEFFPDLLGDVLARCLGEALVRGFPSDYVERAESLGAVRGKIDVARLHGEFWRSGRIPCVFGEFSTNTSLNAALVHAARTLVPLVSSPRLAAQLHEFSALLPDVELHPLSADALESLVIPRGWEFLAPAARVARLLAIGDSFEHGVGADEIPGFLWKSEVVFENFVSWLLSKSCRHTVWSLESGRIDLADPLKNTSSMLQTDPDVRLVSASGEKIILDAKYKNLVSQPDSDDVYQVMASCRVTGSSLGCLVYPAVPGTAPEPKAWKIRGPSHSIVIAAIFVDVAQAGTEETTQDLIASLQRDVEALWTLAGEA